ncbi:MAG: hypothetical protein KKA79_02975 [Nanoarchaeota archaeon]|nr:hypothetical protein [Nanoarchaeota archaeon]
MDEVIGVVIGIRSESHLDISKPVLEIELDEQDTKLLNWHNQKVLIKKIK